MALSDIKTIVILMMENRSFDHMLGYLGLPGSPVSGVEGLRDDAGWLAAHANRDSDGSTQPPFLSDNPYTMPDRFDPPHERPAVEANLGQLGVDDIFAMDGFIAGIPEKICSDPDARKLVMSHFNGTSAPMTDFLARNFTICDQWFSALPAGTQANRLMAMSGYSLIDTNQTPLPNQDLVYDWLTHRNVSWRVYHQGLPFFALMPNQIPAILGEINFRDYRDFAGDILHTPPNQLPQVIFIEPTYGDAPHLGRSTDDHAPAGISDGEGFILETYNAITESDAFWKGCLFIVDFDEHGGFYDHVSPPLVATAPPPGSKYPDNPFRSLGVRTPGLLVSPFVKPGAVCHNRFDHTSVLKLLGQKFDPDEKYSPVVDNREVDSLSVALDFSAPLVPSPVPASLDSYFALQAAAPPPATAVVPDTRGPNILPQAFADALQRMRTQGADASHPKFGQLISAIDEGRTV
jgi:phospholipase C